MLFSHRGGNLNTGNCTYQTPDIMTLWFLEL